MNEQLSSSTFFTGGLELPCDLGHQPFTFLFIGSESSLQFRNIMLRFLSSRSPPENYWVWKPKERQLLKDNDRNGSTISPTFQRQLNRRFYLVQKARMASVFGILVANLSDRSMRPVVHALDQMIRRPEQQQQGDRKSYIFAVGKINPAKLANFAEIDCFVLVACPEHSLLSNEKEFSTPIITPAELSMALGRTEWGGGGGGGNNNDDNYHGYSLDAQDFLKYNRTNKNQQENNNSGEPGESDGDDDDDDDAPYFNPVSGQYESVTRCTNKERGNNDSCSNDNDLSLSNLPGHGVLTTYRSAASDFLKQREYQGLEVQAGQTEVRVAVPGQQGIASNYNNR